MNYFSMICIMYVDLGIYGRKIGTSKGDTDMTHTTSNECLSKQGYAITNHNCFYAGIYHDCANYVSNYEDAILWASEADAIAYKKSHFVSGKVVKVY
jgi:hypothetical protein